MAKTQSFSDKLKKKRAEAGIHVKVIKGYREEAGNVKFLEKFVKIMDIAEIDKVDITR
jgi:hypothetical protein